MPRLTSLPLVLVAFALTASAAEPINLDINTPPTVIVKHAMVQRTSRLERFYNAGIIGLKSDGNIAVRDASNLKLVQRQIAEKLVDAENEDRKWLTVAIADSNHQPQAKDEVRAQLVKRWRDEMKSGWYIQDDQGNWGKKP